MYIFIVRNKIFIFILGVVYRIFALFHCKVNPMCSSNEHGTSTIT
jgi:hypothetical protein